MQAYQFILVGTEGISVFIPIFPPVFAAVFKSNRTRLKRD